MAMIALKSCCIEAAEYNEMVDKVRNKSRVVFHLVCKLINDILKSNHKTYYFVIDRQGGRMRYAQPLRTMFGEMALRVIEENDETSSYELSNEAKKIKIDFAIKADDRHLPVSLASMASKYLREQLMLSMNNYFLEKCSQLKPTAGYWTDGTRFIQDLKTIAPHIQYDAKHLIRSR
jgi:ribonuclease HIII